MIVQSFTFCASSHPVTYLGATPVFVDSEADTWNMDPVLLEQAIRDCIDKTGRKPKAIVPVALYGMPYKIDQIMSVADKYDIPVIEDAAEGFGSKFDGQVLGFRQIWRAFLQWQQDHNHQRWRWFLISMEESKEDYVLCYQAVEVLSLLPAWTL